MVKFVRVLSTCVYNCGVYKRERELVGALCAYFHNHCSFGSPKLYEQRIISNLKQRFRDFISTKNGLDTPSVRSNSKEGFRFFFHIVSYIKVSKLFFYFSSS